MKKIMISLIIIILLINIFTRIPDIKAGSPINFLWSKTFGGTDKDEGYSIQQTRDNGYIIAGETNSYGNGNGDVWLIKTNVTGVEQWNKTYGGSASDFAQSVQQTSDGGYIIIGKTSSYGRGNGDIWLIKTNTIGIEQWNKTYGGNSYEWGNSIQQTIDGGYILVGVTNSYGAGQGDMWLIKTNAIGNEEWNKTYGGKNWDIGHSVQKTRDGGYIITGETQSYGSGDDAWLLKTNNVGTEQWNRTYGRVGFNVGWSVQETNDGGFVIVGETDSYGYGEGDIWLIKTNAIGVEQWNKTFGGQYRDEGYSVGLTNDGGYIIAGVTSSYGAGGMDAWLIKTNANGVEQWNTTYGGIGYDCSWSVQQTIDSGYVITGYTDSFGAGHHDVLLVKYSGQKENGKKNDSSNSTPGFNFLMILAALIIILLWKRGALCNYF